MTKMPGRASSAASRDQLVDVLEASHSVPQRLPDRLRTAGVSHHVRFVLASRPTTPRISPSVISLPEVLVRAVQPPLMKIFTCSAPA